MTPGAFAQVPTPDQGILAGVLLSVAALVVALHQGTKLYQAWFPKPVPNGEHVTKAELRRLEERLDRERELAEARRVLEWDLARKRIGGLARWAARAQERFKNQEETLQHVRENEHKDRTLLQDMMNKLAVLEHILREQDKRSESDRNRGPGPAREG